MAIRVMGVYASHEGVAVTLSSGGKLRHHSWHSSYIQPDGTPLYPAEEIHKLVTSLAPDEVVLYETSIAIAPLKISLPRLKPKQLFRAVELELSSRGIDEIFNPSVGFCPSNLSWKKERKKGLSGFALVADREDLEKLEERFRPLGIAPTLLTLPIFPLAFVFLRHRGRAPAVLFLLEGPLVMIALLRDGVLQDMEVFCGTKEMVCERIAAYRQENSEADVFGFEAVAPRGKASLLSMHDLFFPLEEGEDVERLVEKRQFLSREALAGYLSELYGMIGGGEFGGLRVKQGGLEEANNSKAAKIASLFLVMILLGGGAVMGIQAWQKQKVYSLQKRAMRNLVKTVWPNAPSLVTMEMLTSRFRELTRDRRKLAPFMEPTLTERWSKYLLALDRVGKIRLVEVEEKRDIFRAVLEGEKTLQPQLIKKRLEEAGQGTVKVTLVGNQHPRYLTDGKVFEVQVAPLKGTEAESSAQ